MADPESFVNIFVTHVFELSPCVNKPEYSNILFWGQNDRKAALTIQEHFARASKVIDESGTPLPSDLRKVKNLLALVDGEWHRAKVINGSVDKTGVIEVFCVDIGIFQSLPLKMLKLVPESLEFLFDCPSLASRYCLADVVVGKDPDLKLIADRHLTLMIRHKSVKTVFVGTYEGFDGARIYLNDQLVAKVLHDKKCVEPSKSFEEAIKMPVPTTELPALKSTFTFNPNNSSAKSAPVCIARPLPNTETPKMPVQPIQKPPPSSNNSTKHLSAQENYTAAFLERDVVHNVTVTHIQNGPARFTVRRKCPEVEFGLADIQQRIAEHLTSQFKLLANPTRGMACIAKSTSDNSLNRGLITASEDTQTFNVYFVDHGRFELVSQSKLYKIPSDLLAIELMSVRVCLYEAEELAKFNGVIERFSKLALNNNFHVRVMLDSNPQAIQMFDDSGRNVKDIIKAQFTDPHLVLDAATPSIFLNEPKKALAQISPRPEHARVDIKIDHPVVDPTEKLFVTYVGPPGKFFGQFEKKTMEDLEAINEELKTVYDNQSNNLPLLYSDVRSHSGDFAVVRWTYDDKFYRVKVLKEHLNDVEVYLVDYGDVIRVFRHEIWAPVKALKLFMQTPFGINCFVSGVTATEEDWGKLISFKSVSVEVGPGMESFYSVTFTDDALNAQLAKANSEGKSKMPKAISPLPTIQIDDVPLSMHTNGKLVVLDDSDENNGGRGRSSPSGASSVRSFGSVNDWFVQPRKPNLPVGSRNGLETFELKISPRRLGSGPIGPGPLAHAAPLFFPDMKNIEGATKAVEVVHIDGTDSFYCHIVEDRSALEDMVERLNAAYSDETKDTMQFTRVGQACVARYVDGDGAWYRGKILEISGTEVNILFVDYGNQQRGPLSSLKVIDQEFVLLPPQAYHCSLRRAPPNGDKGKFEAAVLCKELQASFYRIGSDKKYQTKLYYEENASRVVINEQFGAPAVDSVPAPADDFTSLSVPTAPIEVVVGWFSTVNRFYLTPSDLSPYQADLDEMEAFYSSLAFGELVEDQPKVGLPCVVRYFEDQKYYRAKILFIKDQSAQVVFVDYGNEQDTPIKDLKRITPRFIKLPQLAWECKLKDAKVLPPTGDSIKHIESSLPPDVTLSALFHPPGSDGVYPVQVTHPKLGDVFEYLVSHKVVERTTSDSSGNVKLPAQHFNFTLGQVISSEAAISFVTSTVEFWIQPDHKRVGELMAQLDGLAAKPGFICSRSFTPAIGKTCLACYDDQRWYRAVIEKLDGDMASVYYADYGNTCLVNTRDLRTLPSEYAKEAPMAYKCRLDGAECATNETTEKLDAYVDVPFLTVHLIAKTADDVLQVRLQTKDGADIGEKLGLPAPTRQVLAYISYAKSPSQFWIQLKEDEERLNTVETKLGELNGPCADALKLTDEPVVGGVYAVYHPEYVNWFRARVLAAKSSTNGKFLSLFVDYGDTYGVSAENIRQLPSSLDQIPHLAVECCVKGDWSKEAVDHFSELLTNNLFQMKLAGKEGNVQLVESINRDTEDVLHTMRQLKQAEPSPDAFQDECQPANEEASPVETSARTLDAANYCAGQILTVKGSVSVITSAWNVWIHLDPAAAVDFSDQIFQHTSSADFVKASVDRPTVGGLYLAQYPDDSSWYRAEVTSIDATKGIGVTYVDYGNSCVVDAKLLKPLPDALNQVPPFAKRFALDGVERANQPLPDAARLQGVLFDKEFSVTFIKKSGEHSFVRLYDSGGDDLNQQLGLPVEALVDHSVVAQDISQLPAPVTIPPNAVEVVVSHIKSNNTFWIQKRSDESLVRQIENAMCMMEPELAEAPARSVAEGQLCVVRHRDKQRFVRARVATIEGEAASVFLIDIGETLTVQRSDLICCPVMLQYIPPVAVECTFRTPIYPDQYSEELFKAFRDATDGCVCHAVFCGPAGDVQTLETLYANGVDVLSTLSGHLVSSTPQSGKAITGNNFPMFVNGNQRGL